MLSVPRDDTSYRIRYKKYNKGRKNGDKTRFNNFDNSCARNDFNIPSNAVVGGNPAKVIKMRE